MIPGHEHALEWARAVSVDVAVALSRAAAGDVDRDEGGWVAGADPDQVTRQLVTPMGKEAIVEALARLGEAGDPACEALAARVDASVEPDWSREPAVPAGLADDVACALRDLAADGAPRDEGGWPARGNPEAVARRLRDPREACRLMRSLRFYARGGDARCARLQRRVAEMVARASMPAPAPEPARAVAQGLREPSGLRFAHVTVAAGEARMTRDGRGFVARLPRGTVVGGRDLSGATLWRPANDAVRGRIRSGTAFVVGLREDRPVRVRAGGEEMDVDPWALARAIKEARMADGPARREQREGTERDGR